MEYDDLHYYDDVLTRLNLRSSLRKKIRLAKGDASEDRIAALLDEAVKVINELINQVENRNYANCKTE